MFRAMDFSGEKIWIPSGLSLWFLVSQSRVQGLMVSEVISYIYFKTFHAPSSIRFGLANGKGFRLRLQRVSTTLLLKEECYLFTVQFFIIIELLVDGSL